MAGARAEFPDIELHLIGPLQSNKAAEAVALFDAIHTIDRDKIAGGDRRRDAAAGADAAAAGAGQHRRRGAEGGRGAGGDGRVRRALPRGARARRSTG